MTKQKHIRQIENSLPINRQVRFGDVTISFYFVDLRSIGIGEALVDLIRTLKKKLEPYLRRFKLPKVVRVLVWESNQMVPGSSATFGGYLPYLSKPFDMCINTDNLLEEELAHDSQYWIDIRLLQIFPHELAHFNTPDEEEANRISLEVLKELLT